jgi:hypothetical protein
MQKNTVNIDLGWLLLVRVEFDDHALGGLVPRLDDILNVEVVGPPRHFLSSLERFTQRQDRSPVDAHHQIVTVRRAASGLDLLRGPIVVPYPPGSSMPPLSPNAGNGRR